MSVIWKLVTSISACFFFAYGSVMISIAAHMARTTAA